MISDEGALPSLLLVGVAVVREGGSPSDVPSDVD